MSGFEFFVRFFLLEGWKDVDYSIWNQEEWKKKK